jgi:hypothetical protein
MSQVMLIKIVLMQRLTIFQQIWQRTLAPQRAALAPPKHSLQGLCEACREVVT